METKKEAFVPSFLQKPEPITDIKEVKEYDIVVIGAGTPGIPCALKAAEDGAKVALIQKEETVSACGNGGAGIILEESDPEAVEAAISEVIKTSDYRAKRERVETWAYHSGEACKWLFDHVKKAGGPGMDLGNPPQQEFLDAIHNPRLKFITTYFGPKPFNVISALMAIMPTLEKAGVDVFYKTPAEQLVMEDGRCVGVIAKTDDGYVEFRAKYGVVVGTGDYQNDPEMLDYYLPDMVNFETKKFGRTGDGHKMIAWAGGHIENLGHTKMCHDFDAGPANMMNLPFMRVKLDGHRFCDETIHMEYMNCFLTGEKDTGHYCQIFDINYLDYAKEFGTTAAAWKELVNYMPEQKVAKREGVVVPLINTWQADTLEELAAKLGIHDVEAFKEQVARYNEFAKSGKDLEFGVDAKYLKPIDTPPFFGIHRHIRLTMACSGVDVNGELQCLDIKGEPIPGLYAIGNTAGNFYGSVDYPLDIFGLNLGHNYTDGYVVGKNLAAMKNGAK